MSCILIGFMGSGKSTVANLVAKARQLPLIELDDQIVQLSGLVDINTIFTERGEEHFRQLELQAVRELPQYSLVLSTGGGVVTQEKAMLELKERPEPVVYLAASFSKIMERLAGDATRPLFRDTQQARTLYEARLSLYEHYADWVINTDHSSATTVTSKVLARLL